MVVRYFVSGVGKLEMMCKMSDGMHDGWNYSMPLAMMRGTPFGHSKKSKEQHS